MYPLYINFSIKITIYILKRNELFKNVLPKSTEIQACKCTSLNVNLCYYRSKSRGKRFNFLLVLFLSYILNPFTL